MGDTEIDQEVIVEKVAKWSVTHIMKKAGYPEILLYKGEGRAFLAEGPSQRRVEMSCEFPGEMHRT
jgi:hypothetical protein